MKLNLNSDLEVEITSDLQVEIGIPEDEIEMAQDEIGFRFGPGGWNHFGPRSKSLRTQDEITSDLGRNHFGPLSPIRTSDLGDGIALRSRLPG